MIAPVPRQQAVTAGGLPPKARRIVTVLGVTIWIVLGVNLARPGILGFNGHVKGEDYAHFYTIGRLVAEDRHELLYDTAGQAKALPRIIPGAPQSYFIPVYGPQVALTFRGYSSVSYLPSLALWTLTTVALFLVCCYVTWRACARLHAHRADVLLLTLASPALWQLVLNGQTSAVAMAALTGGWLCLRRQRDVLAGLAFGVLFFKPQFALALCVVLAVTGRWKVLAGMAITTMMQVGIGWAYFGEGVMLEYAGMIARLPSLAHLLEPKLYLTYSFRSFFAMLPWIKIYALPLSMACSLAVLTRVARHWGARMDEDVNFAALLLATILVSPHSSVYDLVIVMPALLILGDRLLVSAGETASAIPWRGPGWSLLGAAYLLPLWSTASTVLYVQPLVICLVWLLVEATKVGRASAGVRSPAGEQLERRMAMPASGSTP